MKIHLLIASMSVFVLGACGQEQPAGEPPPPSGQVQNNDSLDLKVDTEEGSFSLKKGEDSGEDVNVEVDSNE